MPTDAQRRNLASAHHAEVQALNERVALLEQQLAEAKRQMESQKDEWLAWEAKRAALEKDAERLDWMIFYSASLNHGNDGEYCRVVWRDPEFGEQATRLFGDSREAIDAAITSTQEQA